MKKSMPPNVQERKVTKIPLDIAELRKSNVLITGTNQQGKSRLAMAISDKLQNQGLGLEENWQIIVFDNVGHWKSKSSIPHYLEVSENSLRFVLPEEESIIFDISKLLPVFQKEFVENVLADLWTKKLNGNLPRWTLIIFEEAHLYMRNTRSLVSQNIMRIFSVGANWKIRTLAITPSLTGIDAEFIRLTGQRYHFKLGLELNAKRRFKGYYGKDWLRVAVEALDIGYCIYYIGGKLEVKHIPLFESDVKPRPYKIKQIIRETKPKKKGILHRIFGEAQPSIYVRPVKRDRELEEELDEDLDYFMLVEDL